LAGGAVITKDVESYTIVGGVPAKFIRYRFSTEIINQLKVIKWWEIMPEDLLNLDLSNIQTSIKELSNYDKSKKRSAINYHRVSK